MELLTKYKLTDQTMCTHCGFQWHLGEIHEIDTPGNVLCSADVFHFYDSPELAVLLNPAHAHIQSPRLFAVECDQVAHDGLKGGAKRMRLTKELPLPVFTTKQRVAFAIYCALAVYDEPKFHVWAANWLAGKDRGAQAAWAAARAAETAAARAAARAAETAGLKIDLQQFALRALVYENPT